MRKRLLRHLLPMFCAVSLATALSCRQREPETWIPVFEETGYSYLDDTVGEIREGLRDASGNMAGGDPGAARKALDRTEDSLLALQHYYLPLTWVRQYVYDADRLYFLKKTLEAKERLDRARASLAAVGEADGPALRSAVEEVIVMVDDLILALEESSPSVPEKFRALGHKINLMLNKGALILAGADFGEKR